MGGGVLTPLGLSVRLVWRILADIILSVFGYDRAIPQVVSWVLMQLGSAAGQWIPIWFFTYRFRQDWIDDRGQSAATMDAMIHYAVGIWGNYFSVSCSKFIYDWCIDWKKSLKKYKK